jgi:hypothetical protein
MAQLFDDPMQDQLFFSQRSQPQQATKKKGGKGGTPTSLISEGGALGGALIGAGVGSAVPVIGTAIGGIIGAGVGAFAGRSAENKIRDNEYRVGDAAKEGLLSAALAGPLKLGKYGLTAGKAAIAGKGATAALTEGAEQAAKFTIRGSLGKAAAGAADDMAIKAFKLTPSQLTKFKKLYGEDVAKTITRNGLQGASVDDFGSAIMKQQDLFDSLIDTAGTIKKSDLQNRLTKIYTKLMKQAPADTKLKGQAVKSEVDDLLKGLGDEVSAADLNIIRRQYDDLVNYGNKIADPTKYDKNKRIADALRKSIQKASGSDDLKNAGMEISKLRRLSDFVEMQANRGRGANPIGLTTLLAAGVGGGMGGAPGALATAGAAKVANSPAALKAASLSALKGSEKLAAGAARATAQPIKQAGIGAARGQVAQGLAGALMNPTPINAASDVSADQSLNTYPMNNPTNTQANSTSMMNSLYDTPQELAIPESPYPRENLLADIQRDPQNTNKYLEYYQTMQEIYAAPESTTKPLSSEAAKTQSNALAGLEAIDDFQNIISSNPSAFQRTLVPGRTAVGGYLGRALGTTGIDASTQQIIDVIARLRTGAAISKEEERRFTQFIPRPGDPENVRAQKLGYLRRQFERVASEVGPSSGGSDLESALLAQ